MLDLFLTVADCVGSCIGIDFEPANRSDRIVRGELSGWNCRFAIGWSSPVIARDRVHSSEVPVWSGTPGQPLLGVE